MFSFRSSLSRNCTVFLILSALSGLIHAAPDPFSVEDGIAAPCPLPGAPFIPPAAPLTLPEVIDLALCHNPKTRSAWANAKIEANLLGQAQAAYLPSLDGQLESSRKKTRYNHDPASTDRQKTASLSLSWLLLDFGGRSANMDYQRQLLSAALAEQETARQTVFLETLNAFYQVHAHIAAVEAAKASEAAAERSFRTASGRYQAGVATPVEQLQAETAFSQAVLSRIKSEGELANARGALAYALGLDAHVLIPLINPGVLPALAEAQDFTNQIEELIARAIANRPDIAASEARYRAAEAATRAARSQGLPTLSFSAFANRQEGHATDSRSGSLGLTLRVPLFSGFADSYRIRAAEARLEQSGVAREQLLRDVSLDVWRSAQELRVTTQSLATTLNLFASAEAAEAMALGRYQSGVGTILDVLNAQSALADARMQRISAAYNWRMHRAALARALGTLGKPLLDELLDTP